MFNLLPQQQKKAVIRQYRWRVAIVASIGFVVLFATAIAFLVPTFLFSRITFTQLTERQSHLQTTAERDGRTELLGDLKKWQNLTTLLHPQNENQAHIFQYINEIEDRRASTIAVSGFDFTRTSLKDAPEKQQIELRGTARDRRALFDFQTELEGSELFEKVELPVSNFAANINIDFVMTITIRASQEN